jgi:hypothetical protein
MSPHSSSASLECTQCQPVTLKREVELYRIIFAKVCRQQRLHKHHASATVDVRQPWRTNSLWAHRWLIEGSGWRFRRRFEPPRSWCRTIRERWPEYPASCFPAVCQRFVDVLNVGAATCTPRHTQRQHAIAARCGQPVLEQSDRRRTADDSSKYRGPKNLRTHQTHSQTARSKGTQQY